MTRSPGAPLGPVESLISKAAPDEDEWALEAASASIAERLATLRRSIERGESAGWSALLSKTFRGSSLVPKVLEQQAADASVRAWRGVTDGEPDLDPDTWLRRASELGASFRRVERAALKVIGIESSETRQIAASVLVELAGESRSGVSSQVRSIWRTTWVPPKREGTGGDDWRLDRLRVERFDRAEWTGASFRDVTSDVLAGTPAFREQLALGQNDWWQRLDAASGIDIYGHQGVAVGDVDGDGREDLFVAQAGGLPNRLFLQRSDGTFDEASAARGVDVLDATGGALLVDLDGDGDRDLALATSLAVLLYENDGRGFFRPASVSGLHGTMEKRATTIGVAAADYDADGDLDLYAYSYIFWDGAGSKTQSSYPFPYHDANNGAPNFLFRNDGDWEFSDMTQPSGLDAGNRRYSFAASWCDYDGDGDVDLYVANDFGRNNLYRNDGRGRFEDVALEAGVEDTGNGMGVTWGDIDGDGWIDLYVSNMWSSAGHRIALQPRFGERSLRETYARMARGNSVYRNRGDGTFEDVTARSEASFGRWSWASQFLDVECDGTLDLYVANGFVSGTEKDDL